MWMWLLMVVERDGTCVQSLVWCKNTTADVDVGVVADGGERDVRGVRLEIYRDVLGCDYARTEK